VISLTDFFAAASRRHNDVILVIAIRRVSGNDFVPAAPTHRAAHVQQLNCCVKKRQTFLRPTCWPPNSSDLSPAITRSELSCSIMFTTKEIHSVDELKRRLIDVWCGLEQSIFDEAIDQWQGRYLACVHAKTRHFSSTACELKMLILTVFVTFNSM